MAQVHQLGPRVGRHLALVCIHRVWTRWTLAMTLSHDDSTINIVSVIIIIIIISHVGLQGQFTLDWPRVVMQALGTDVSWLPDQVCGTVFQLVLGKRTSAVNSLNGCYKTYLLGRWDRGTLWLLNFKFRLSNVLSFLLTYFILKETRYSSPYIHQILIDFKNSFTDTLGGKFAMYIALWRTWLFNTIFLFCGVRFAVVFTSLILFQGAPAGFLARVDKHVVW